MNEIGTIDGAAIRAAIKEAKAKVASGLDNGLGGVELSEQLTADVDAVVVPLLSRALGDHQNVPVAVFAAGGYGRREMAPGSDLDLIFVCEDHDDPRIGALAHAVLQPLWDGDIEAGHSVRSLEDAVDLSADDLTSATALLDTRFLTGDKALGERFMAAYEAWVDTRGEDGLVARMRKEQRVRHAKFGDTIFLLEPDLKSGPGGLRDLCAGRWAAKARFGTSNPDELVRLGVLSDRQAADLVTARDWLLRMRIALHLQAGRHMDRLRFPMQEAIGPRLFPDAVVAAGPRSEVGPAVERLMHQYQLHAKTIRRETIRLFYRAAVEGDVDAVPSGKRLAHPSGGNYEDFVEANGCVEIVDPAVFRSRPVSLLELFAVALEAGLPVGLQTADAVELAAAEVAVALREDEKAKSLFFQILTDKRDPVKGAVLEQMHDTGVLAALMPAWGPIAGRVQHDMFHVYTVDRHALYAVAMLKALHRGDHVSKYPWQTAEMQNLERPRVLYLATLLHDIGKALGSNHARRGAVLAVSVARELGLSDSEVDDLRFLVRHHLVMRHWSQRRDLEDLGLISRLAKLVRTAERLRSLFLLSFVDICSIGPKEMTSWKDSLLRRLFHQTMIYLTKGPDLLRTERAKLVAQRQTQAAAELGEILGASIGDRSDRKLDQLFDELPSRYFIENSVPKIVEHMQLMAHREGACAIATSRDDKRKLTEFTVVADDQARLLASVSGVLYANGLDVVEASIYTRSPSAPLPQAGGKFQLTEALDVFQLSTNQDLSPGSRKLETVTAQLDAVLSGQTNIDEVVAGRTKTCSLFEPDKPEVPNTEIRIDNEISTHYTVVEVFTEDKPGVLFVLAHALSAAGVHIHRSRIGAEADRVADVFYVAYAGGKLLDIELRASLEKHMREALEGLED